MVANVIVTIERRLDHPRDAVFRAWTDPATLARWRGSPGWHVEAESCTGDPRLGGHHTHVKVRDDDPTVRVTTTGVYTEFFDPDVFVSAEKITGDEGIDPNAVLELRVELTRYGREGRGTLVRIIQGPHEPDVADWHGEGWRRELGRLAALLDGPSGPGAQTGPTEVTR